MTSTIKVDTISENTSANGVAVDGVTLKDGAITSTAASTITVADNSDNLTLTSTDADSNSGPNLRLYRNNDSNGDGDVLGQIDFDGRNDNSQDVVYARIRAVAEDISDGTEDARLIIEKAVNGSTTEIMRSVGSETVFNDGSADLDFRVESNNNSGMFFVNAGSDHVSVGTDGDLGGVFNVSGETVMRTAGNSDTLTLKCTDADAEQGPVLRLTRDSSSPANDDVLGRIFFTGEDAGSNATNYVQLTSQASNVAEGSETANFQFEMFSGGSNVEFLKFQGGTGTVFNEGSADLDFRVESNNKTHALFVDAGNDRIGIGTDSPVQTMHIRSMGNPSNDTGLILEGNATDSNVALYFYNSAGSERGRILYDTDDNNLQFKVNAGEKLRITSGGFLKAITSGSFIASAQFHEFTNSAGSQQTVFFRHSDANHPYGLQMEFSAAAPDNNTHWFYLASDSSAVRFRVMSDGDVQNHDNAYGAISDERIKQDIRDSNSQWDDIKAVKVRNFKKKDDVRQYGDNAWEQIGVVAQELEAVSPKLIRHNDPDASDILSDSSFGTLYEDGDDIPEDKKIGDVKEIKEQVKSVNYSILYMKAIKALQEAQTRIETLETKVAALEG